MALTEALAGEPIDGLNHLLKTRPRSVCLAVTETLERHLPPVLAPVKADSTGGFFCTRARP